MSNSVPNSIIVYYQIAPKRIHPSTVHNIIYIYINIGYKDMTNRTRRRNCQECEAVKRQYHFVSRTLQTGQPVWSPISNHSVEMLYWPKKTPSQAGMLGIFQCWGQNLIDSQPKFPEPLEDPSLFLDKNWSTQSKVPSSGKPTGRRTCPSMRVDYTDGFGSTNIEMIWDRIKMNINMLNMLIHID